MPEFSAIVHTYNRAHILPKTLEAIRSQSYGAAELILVDDGSQDGTEKLARESFPEFKYFRIENSGPGAARKVGAEAASKEWLAFCDDDDVWLADHLERRAELIKTFPEAHFTCSNFGAFGPTANPQYDHYASAPDGWWSSATERRVGEFYLLSGDAFLQCLKFNPAFPLVWAVRRDFYRESGGIESRYSRWLNEDTAYFRKCLLTARLACDHKITAMYQRHTNNFSGIKFRQWSGRADILEDLVSRGVIPKQYLHDVGKEVLDSRKTACLQAYWTRNYEGMLDVYKKLPSKHRDLGLRTRAFVTRLLRPREAINRERLP